MTDSLVMRAQQAVDASAREEWLTVKEFAARVGMSEHGVREAIRKGTLGYRIERVTTGPKGAIRIVLPTPG